MAQPGREVLIAEGDPELALMLQKALRIGGFAADLCQDGFDVVRRVSTSPPDLLVCGIYLPGLSGLRICRYLRNDAILGAIPILMLVPRVERSVLHRARRAGADRILEIPVPMPEIVSVCQDLLAEARPRPAASARHIPPDREGTLDELVGILETGLTRLETVRDLCIELSTCTSVSEIFRAIAAAAVTGLGFDRVQVFRYRPETDDLVLESSLGRGLAQDPGMVMSLRGQEGMPAAIAVRELRQVLSREAPLPEIKIAWFGSADYVDTPLAAGRRLMGLVRVDRQAGAEKPGRSELEVLEEFCAQASAALAAAVDMEQISESRDQIAAILSSLDSAVVLVDTTLRITDATARARDIFGMDPDSMKGRPLYEALPLLSKDPRPEMLRGVFLEGRAALEQGVSIQIGASGQLVVNLRYAPFRRGGRISGAMILATDVTEENSLREDLRRRNDELENLSRIGRDMNASTQLDEIGARLLGTLRKFYPDEAISILVPEETSSDESFPESLKVVAQSGYPDETDGFETHRSVIFPKLTGNDALPQRRHSIVGLVANAFIGKKIVNVPDVALDSRYVPNLPNTRSEIAVPMVVHEKTMGVIDLQSSVRGRFDEDSERRIGTLANHAATALENARLQAQYWEMAQRDKLTNLRNLRFFDEKLKEELARAERHYYECSLIMIDIDDFKHYNDSFGHPVGNLLLRSVARAIQSALRGETGDTLARYGGEEFVCILPFASGKVAAEIAERIRKSVLAANQDIPHATEQPQGCVSISLGVSTFPSDVPEMDKLLEVADQRLYLAKRAGKNRVFAPALGNCPQIRR
ncbi:diguanylate cyclase [Candidatus Fermentibacteria bacterium]|nr:diguanylate cyclase [Candidatus Fermentibacteria bacterium]